MRTLLVAAITVIAMFFMQVEESPAQGSPERYDVGNGVVILAENTVPVEAISLLKEAVIEWDGVLIRNDAPLEIVLEFADIRSFNHLAHTYTSYVTVDNVMVPTSLRNAKLGFDSLPGSPDMRIVVDSSRNWDYSKIPISSYLFNLKSILLHELGHGYGISAPFSDGKTSLFGELLYYDKRLKLTETDDLSIWSSGNVWLKTVNSWVRVETPRMADSKVNLSHLEREFHGGKGDLMTSSVAPEGGAHKIDDVIVDVMEAIGWDVKRLSVTVERSEGTAITRLYSAYFGREPDPEGNHYWSMILLGGFSLGKISSEFALSAEFQQRFGNLDDYDFVDQMYQQVFDRQSDLVGLNYWIGQLGPRFSRGDLMVEFSNSPENIRRTISLRN